MERTFLDDSTLLRLSCRYFRSRAAGIVMEGVGLYHLWLHALPLQLISTCFSKLCVTQTHKLSVTTQRPELRARNSIYSGAWVAPVFSSARHASRLDAPSWRSVVVNMDKDAYESFLWVVPHKKGSWIPLDFGCRSIKQTNAMLADCGPSSVSCFLMPMKLSGDESGLTAIDAAWRFP